MQIKLRSVVGVSLMVLMTIPLIATTSFAHGVRTYEVQITNLSSGQPLTPPIIATHSKKNLVFEVGKAASNGIKEIAENGNSTPLLLALGKNRRVSAVKQAGMGPLVPEKKVCGGTFANRVTTTITASGGAKFLSAAAMLICTNDGFTGVNAVKLPKKVGQAVAAFSAGYDAGTEKNTQRYADMVPPCQALIAGIMPPVGGTGMSNPALAEGGRIHHHRGIVGGKGNLTTALHGFTNPVLEIVIRRVK